MSRSPEEHLAAIRHMFGPRRTEMVPIKQALNRRISQAITAHWDSPRFDNSQMDGYALHARHLNGGHFGVGHTIAAGTDPADYYPQGLGDQICPIMTGARLPAGTSAIIPIEKTTPGHFDATRVSIPPTPIGQFMRSRGSDIAAGTQLFPAETLLTPIHIGVLASQSIAAVEAFRPPTTLLITGGAEINNDNSPATIPDANGPLLLALCEQTGIDVLEHLHTDDNPERLSIQLKEAIDQHKPDAVITSGGISHGKFEVIRQILEPTEGSWFGHVDQQPGGPQGLAIFHGTPVIALPGNPISTLVSFMLFAAPALNQQELEFMEAQLTTTVTGLPDNREQFLRGVRGVVDKQVCATPIDGAGSHLLARAATADCLIRIPAQTTVEAGACVKIYPLN